MSAEGSDDGRGWLRRAAGAGALVAVIAVIGWDAPRVLGSGAGYLSCIILAASAGTLGGLIVQRPRRWAVLTFILAVVAVGLVCSGSALYTSRTSI